MDIGLRLGAWNNANDIYHGYPSGLLAYWDGIDNIGQGDANHSDNATSWIDLVSKERNWTLSTGGSWTDNALSGNGNCAAYQNSFNGLTQPTSVSYVLRVPRISDTSTNRIIIHARDWHGYSSMYRCVIFRNSNSLHFMSDCDYGNSPHNVNFINKKSVIVNYFNGWMNIYVNGQLIAPAKLYDNWYWDDAPVNCIGNRPSGGRGSECEISKIQYYDHTLSDAEIAKIYGIDKSRYNLA